MGRIEYKWGVLISVIFGIFMVILDSTVVNVAFPTLREEFHASLSDGQWVISLYTLALGISTPLSGFLGDRFGIKRIYLTGLLLFVAGSFICGIAPNLPILIAARAVQGFGGGIALPLGTALLFGAFKPSEQGLALGIFGIALVLAPALGPILGGWLVDANLWRFIFFINVPIGVLGAVVGWRLLREKRAERVPAFDWLGLITSTIGFGATLYAASIAADDGWTSPKVLGFFALGGAGLIAFALVELFVVKEPLLNLRLFQKPVFLLASLVGYVSVVALFGAEFLLPLYLQTLRGKPALETGFILLPLAISAGFMTPIAGRLYDKIGPRPLMVLGFALLLVNTWQFSQLDATTEISWILLLLAVRGLALGLTVQTTLVAALAVVAPPEVSRASALSNATRQVVQSIGVAVLATILASTLSANVKSFQTQIQNLPGSSTVKNFAICDPRIPGITAAPGGSGTQAGGPPPGVTGGGQPSGPFGLSPQQANALLDQACAESIQGYERAYQFTFYMAIVALVLGALLPGWPLKFNARRAARPEPGVAKEAPAALV